MSVQSKRSKSKNKKEICLSTIEILNKIDTALNYIIGCSDFESIKEVYEIIGYLLEYESTVREKDLSCLSEEFKKRDWLLSEEEILQLCKMLNIKVNDSCKKEYKKVLDLILTLECYDVDENSTSEKIIINRMQKEV